MKIRSTNGSSIGIAPSLRLARVAGIAVTLGIGACSSGSGGTPSPTPETEAPNDADAMTDAGGSVVTDVNATPGASPTDSSASGEGSSAPLAGDIARFGVIAVGDENGQASGDLRAAFSRLSTSVAPEAFGNALASGGGTGGSVCSVSDADGGPNQDTLSVALYLPTAGSVASDPIGAGDAVLLSSDAGSWVELQGGPSARFYTLSSADAVPAGPVPTGLVANVTGDEFPAFTDARLPDVAPLIGASHGGGDITPDTRFTWQAGTATNARVRIEAMSAGSFFIEDGTAVSCLVPDTGEFAFPAETRQALGGTFAGAAPDLSRVAIESVREGDALLFLVRESFAR